MSRGSSSDAGRDPKGSPEANSRERPVMKCVCSVHMHGLRLVVGLVALVGCGSVDSKKQPDAAVTPMVDAAIDAPPPECPIGVTALCDGASLVTCDGQGNVTATTECAAGCNSSERRCNLVTPSNVPSTMFDEAAASTDLVLSGSATIDTDAGTIVDQSGTRTPLTSTIATGAGVPVGLLVVKVKSFTTGGNVTVTGSRGLVILSGGDVTIDHTIGVSAALETNGPGAITNDASCRGKNAAAGNANGTSGGGGGGFGTAGGSGGSGGSPSVAGGGIGAVAGNPELVPLRGGCPGGRAGGAPANHFAGGGGGAIQITSGTKIAIADGAAILASGGGARGPTQTIFCIVNTPCGVGDGGGSGGGVLLEAPVVTLAATGGVFANGGGGKCGVFGAASNGQRSTTPAPGQQCSGNTGNGGNGGVLGVNPQNGANGSGNYPVGGGAGGGIGRLRVNLPLGATFQPEGVITAVLSAGVLQTR
jgi:hypothetical protein